MGHSEESGVDRARPEERSSLQKGQGSADVGGMQIIGSERSVES